LRNKIRLSVRGISRDEIYEKSMEVVAKYIGVATVAEARTQITGIEIDAEQEGQIFVAIVWINLK
jgi:hypothetical protein